jgi:Zn-dependent M28 family amino/carboxypeptidase
MASPGTFDGSAGDHAGDMVEDAWHYLEFQTRLGPRNPGSTGHRELVDFLVSELVKSADDVQVQPFEVAHEGAKYSMTNVSALFKASDGRERPFILLGAHFDTRPRAECDPVPELRSSPILGANDGASGVAVLLEIARMLAYRRPPVPVMLAFFDGEDFGASTDWMFLGSRRYAETTNPSDVMCVLLLDMIGDEDLDIYVERYSLLSSPDLVDTVWSAAERLGHGQTFHRELGLYILDDHIPFIERGIPSIDIIDFDYPYWHTTLDTADKCSPHSLRIVRDVVLEVILRGEFAGPSLHKPEGF